MVSAFAEREARLVRLTRTGPILVEGPLDIMLPDGSLIRSDRPVVALCACRRSRRYPFCDTSHRGRAPAHSAPSGERPAPQ